MKNKIVIILFAALFGLIGFFGCASYKHHSRHHHNHHGHYRGVGHHGNKHDGKHAGHHNYRKGKKSCDCPRGF